MFERLLGTTRYLVVITVIVSVVSALLLYLMSVVLLYEVIRETLARRGLGRRPDRHPPLDRGSGFSREARNAIARRTAERFRTNIDRWP